MYTLRVRGEKKEECRAVGRARLLSSSVARPIRNEITHRQPLCHGVYMAVCVRRFSLAGL